MNDEFKKRFNYLMSLSNNDLRKEIENSNWVFILQELRYAGETIEAYKNMRKEAINCINKFDWFDGKIPDDIEDVAFQYCMKEDVDDLLNILNKVGSDK